MGEDEQLIPLHNTYLTTEGGNRFCRIVFRGTLQVFSGEEVILTKQSNAPKRERNGSGV